MGFVTEQQEARKAKIDADSAAEDPNYLIAVETGGESGGEAAPEPDQSGAPEGYEAQSAPQ
jgi:hypothetical protein